MSGVLVFGSINLDLSFRGERWPHPGETLLGSALKISPGGKGANQAHAAQQFGARVTMVGAVGQDEFAAAALANLERSGVDLTGVRRLPGAATGAASILVNGQGENAILVAPGANLHVRADWVTDAQIADSALLMLQGEVPLAESMALARRFRRLGRTVMLNLAPAQDFHLLAPECLDWLILNQGELAALAAALGLGTSPTGVAAFLGCHVLVTLGGEGALACLSDGTQINVPARPARVVDTTGAGDTFCGVFAAALSLGTSVEAAVKFACVAASLACERAGAQAAQPSRQDIDSAADVAPRILEIQKCHILWT